MHSFVIFFRYLARDYAVTPLALKGVAERFRFKIKCHDINVTVAPQLDDDAGLIWVDCQTGQTTILSELIGDAIERAMYSYLERDPAKYN